LIQKAFVSRVNLQEVDAQVMFEKNLRNVVYFLIGVYLLVAAASCRL
jgi:hypothetical protein